VRALDGPSAVDGCRGGNFSELEVVDSGCGTDKIHDRVDRADFVKMNGIDWNAVELGLGFSYALKHGEGGVADLGIELRFLEKILNLGPRTAVIMTMFIVVMMVVGVIVRGLDKEAGAGQATSERSLRFQDHFFREVKTLDSLLKEREGHAEVEEGGSKHVSADSGGTIEMEMGGWHDPG